VSILVSDISDRRLNGHARCVERGSDRCCACSPLWKRRQGRDVEGRHVLLFGQVHAHAHAHAHAGLERCTHSLVMLLNTEFKRALPVALSSSTPSIIWSFFFHSHIITSPHLTCIFLPSRRTPSYCTYPKHTFNKTGFPSLSCYQFAVHCVLRRAGCRARFRYTTGQDYVRTYG
jgi:hypothetical protein